VWSGSWLITALVQFTLIALGQTLILTGNILGRSDRGLVFLMFWGFAVSQIAFSFFVASFFSKAKLVCLLPPLARC
jgi:hypothetical protein